MALDELARECTIGLGGRSAWSVLKDGFPKARRLAQTHAARDHSLINAFAEMLAHLCHDLLAEIGPTVEHGHDDAAELEALVRPRITHLLDQPNNFHQAFQREILALYRSQQFVGGGKRIAHQNSKRRRTIQKNKIE